MILFATNIKIRGNASAQYNILMTDKISISKGRNRALRPKRIYIIPALRAFILLYNIDLLIYFVFNII